MTPFLLDTNVLIALLWPSHQDHANAVRWFASNRSNGWATCPITEAGFVRIVSNPAFSRDAVSPPEAAGLLAANTSATDHVFWAADTPFAEATAFAEARLVGHQQVTDAYVLGLATARGGRVATMDRALLALTRDGSVERGAIELIA